MPRKHPIQRVFSPRMMQISKLVDEVVEEQSSPGATVAEKLALAEAVLRMACQMAIRDQEKSAAGDMSGEITADDTEPTDR